MVSTQVVYRRVTLRFLFVSLLQLGIQQLGREKETMWRKDSCTSKQIKYILKKIVLTWLGRSSFLSGGLGKSGRCHSVCRCMSKEHLSKSHSSDSSISLLSST